MNKAQMRMLLLALLGLGLAFAAFAITLWCLVEPTIDQRGYMG